MKKICEYGCGQEAKYELKNGKWCCSPFYVSCPEIRNKNAKGIKEAHNHGVYMTDTVLQSRGWNKGKTAFSDNRISCKYNKELLFNRGTIEQIENVIKKETLLENKCNCCNITEWRGNVIDFKLRKKVEKTRDVNDFELLCPNCFSQITKLGE